MIRFLQRYLIAGLLIWTPILVTFFVIRFLIQMVDNSMAVLPKPWQPQHIIGIQVPGIGLVFALIIIFVTGLLATNFFGRRLVQLWDAFINRLPLIRTIYSSVKQVMDTVFSPTSNSFRRVLLVEYPRRGLWSIAFQTAECCQAVEDYTGQTMVSIFLPTTPNPTSGFFMMLPEEQVVVIDMSVDQALRMIISLGVVQPKSNINTMTKQNDMGV